MKHEKTFAAIAKLKDIEVELHRLKNALEIANKALDAEREACARECDDISSKYKWPDDTAERVASQWCADSIRARGKQ